MSTTENSKLEIPVESYVREELSDQDANAYFDFREVINRDEDPEYIPPDRAQLLQSLRMKHPYIEDRNYFIRKDDSIIANLSVGIMNDQHPAYEKNKHMMFINADVHPDYRRSSMATALLKKAVSVLLEFNRKTILTSTSNPVGQQVCEHFGGKSSLDGAENRLYLDEVNWDMLRTWVEEGPTRASGVTLQEFNILPDDIAEEYMAVYTETMNQQPLGELDFEMRETVESRRVQEKRLDDLGLVWSTLISREADGAISGLTELIYNPTTSHKASQNLTGVKQEYRGRGLGKWLKAELLLRFRERYPTIRYISTGNADANAPMLSINQRMGFKRFKTDKTYTFETEDLIKRINEL